MEIIRQDRLKDHNLCANVIDTYISEWKNGDRFELYKKTLRPFSGLFFILSDIRIVFSELNADGETVRQVHCGQGDILYIPRNILYNILFLCGDHTGPTNTFTINFDLYDDRGESVQPDMHGFLLNNRVNPYMAEDLLMLHKCLRNPMICDKLRINSLFFSTLYYATRNRDHKVSGAIKTAVQAIENEYNRNEKMEKYARICSMSLTSFYREFRAYTGMSPTQYRNHIRINTAKSDIRNTNMTIKEIAMRVGFDDEFYFSRLFKAIVGISPKQFKQK